jgi:hypothetical protein
MAKNLYEKLRIAESNYDYILICPVEEVGFGKAIMNRINKMGMKDTKKNEASTQN